MGRFGETIPPKNLSCKPTCYPSFKNRPCGPKSFGYAISLDRSIKAR